MVGGHQKNLTVREGMFQRLAQMHHYWMKSIIQVVGICAHSHPNTRKGNMFVIKNQREQLLFLKIRMVKEKLAIRNSTTMDGGPPSLTGKLT
jgi:hypothetical protein